MKDGSIENKISDKSEKELYRRTDEVLHYLWDPIGVSSTPEARDEYHAYLPQVFVLLKENGDKFEITNLLSQIQRESLGLSVGVNENTEIAEILIHWKEAIIE